MEKNTKYLTVIKIISVLIPLVVAVLLYVPAKWVAGAWTMLLPAFHAGVNFLTSLVLIAALVSIKKGKTGLHKRLMSVAFTLGILFLLSYVIYHATNPSVSFGDIDHDGVLSDAERMAAGTSRTIYLFLLLSHILLSVAVVPLVLLAFFYALSARVEQHRKIVKFAFPVWLYVSVTGVVIYWLIQPYYP
ncbi:MAG: DUF420 domain-containing protein [Cyclobacteriaceae bacterium]|nr:DUF420 domain-containing protein [Cyclobacteriaceae bacterium]